MNGHWVEGNDIRLLENGEEFFPRVFACIANARQEVVLETFILFEDKVGRQLQEALVAAARRGVQVDMTIDGFGSPGLSERFLAALTEAGVRIQALDPGARLLGWRMNMLRRMHRKIVVVDGAAAFVGGITYSADHLADYGPEAKQDCSAEIRGPPGRRCAAHPAGPTRHGDRQDRGGHALSPVAGRQRADLRIHPAAAARLGAGAHHLLRRPADRRGGDVPGDGTQGPQAQAPAKTAGGAFMTSAGPEGR